MLRSLHPSVEDVVLETLSWEYHETIMAGYEKRAEAALHRVVNEEKGKYLVVVEGSIPTADDGVYRTIGGRTALDIAHEVCKMQRPQLQSVPAHGMEVLFVPIRTRRERWACRRRFLAST